MNEKINSLLLGVHTSISGGFEKSIERAESIGCTAMQIFTKSNRQWRAQPISPEQVTLFIQSWEKSSIQTIIAHASYLINIGALNSDIQKKSIIALIEEIERCAKLSIPYLVLHPGSQGSLEQIGTNLNTVLSQTPNTVMILLETMAGQGKSVAYKFEQLAQIYDMCNQKHRVGICFDTCHAFAAGYDLRTRHAYEKTWAAFDEIIGLEKLKAIHVNDSKKDLGSKIDRHDHIGTGKIGSPFFQFLLTDPRFHSIPKILETPKKTPDDDINNMKKLYELAFAM